MAVEQRICFAKKIKRLLGHKCRIKNAEWLRPKGQGSSAEIFTFYSGEAGEISTGAPKTFADFGVVSAIAVASISTRASRGRADT